MTTWRLESMCTRTLSTTISTSVSSIVPGLSHGRRVRPRTSRVTRRPIDGRAIGAPPADRPDHQRDRHPEHEPADVGEERHPGPDPADAQRRQPVDELEDEPEGQDDERRHVDELVEE